MKTVVKVLYRNRLKTLKEIIKLKKLMQNNNNN